MKAITKVDISGISLTVKPVVILVFILLLLSATIQMVVRQQCIRKGYEIYYLTNQLDMKNDEYELLLREYSNILRREALLTKSLELGFVMPEGGKVFYVR